MVGSAMQYSWPGQDDQSNQLQPPQPSARYIDPRDMAGNALWNMAKRTAAGIYEGIVKPPGEILAGERSPYSMDIPQYAADLAMTGMGTGALLRGGAAAFDPTVMPHFGAWHGTGASQPFREFDPAFLGTGEGSNYRGPGFYVGQAQGTGERYRQIVAGRGPVPLGDDGLPLSYEDTVQKYFEPGSIVPAYGGQFQRIEHINFDPNNPDLGWYVHSRTVHPIHDLIDAKYGSALPYGTEVMPGSKVGTRQYNTIPVDAMSDPSLWSDLARGGPYKNPIQTHATFPDDRELEAVAKARGWKMGDPGGLIHVNVIPEEHEFFDLDLPWKQQTPEIQDKMTKAGLDPYQLDAEGEGIADTYDPATGITDPGRATGEQLRKALVRRENERLYAEGKAEDFDEAAMRVSKMMSEAGIPGNKFLDQQSRHKPYTPELQHVDRSLSTAPDQNTAKTYLQDYPTYRGGDIDSELSSVKDLLQRHINVDKSDIEYFKSTGYKPDVFSTRDQLQYRQDNLNKRQELLDWIEKEHAAGNFRIGDARTRNFVISPFNAKDVEFKTWNGVPLEPVEHDPFAPGGAK